MEVWSYSTSTKIFLSIPLKSSVPSSSSSISLMSYRTLLRRKILFWRCEYYYYNYMFHIIIVTIAILIIDIFDVVQNFIAEKDPIMEVWSSSTSFQIMLNQYHQCHHCHPYHWHLWCRPELHCRERSYFGGVKATI